MKFDTIIAGGGIAGLICGIELQSKGINCLIVSTGQSSLNFQSGSFNLLSYYADGSSVRELNDALEELIRINPKHPYAAIGKENIFSYADSVCKMLRKAEVEVKGEATKNHFRLTPIGELLPTWLTSRNYVAFKDTDKIPYKKILLVDIEGYTDFNAHLVKQGLTKIGAEVEITSINPVALKELRRNPSEMRSSNISMRLDNKSAWTESLDRLKKKAKEVDVVMMPACVSKDDTVDFLTKEIGKSVKLIATLPPSVAGIDAESKLRRYFTKLGGWFLFGDSAAKPYVESGEICGVYTENHGDLPFKSDNVVVATGGLFSDGLVALQDKIYEPVFGLDVEYPKNREDWYSHDFFGKHQYLAAGVKYNKEFQPSIDNKVYDNLYVCGSILSGFDPIKEGSGGGVAMLSAFRVAQTIAQRSNEK